MSKIILEVEDSNLDQFMAMIDLLKIGVVKNLQVQKIDDEFKIDEKHCLEVLERINRGDHSDFIPIGDIDEYIKELKNAIA